MAVPLGSGLSNQTDQEAAHGEDGEDDEQDLDQQRNKTRQPEGLDQPQINIEVTAAIDSDKND